MAQGSRIPDEDLLDAIDKHGGNLAAAAKSLGVSRSGVGIRVRKDPKAKAVTDAARRRTGNRAERTMDELLDCDNPMVRFNAAKFVLSTLCKDRGYTEKSEVDVNARGDITIVLGSECDDGL